MSFLKISSLKARNGSVIFNNKSLSNIIASTAISNVISSVTYNAKPFRSGETVVYTFSGSWTCPTNVDFIDILLVAGGGGGGMDMGGGGGGGGVIETSLRVTPGLAYNIVVGAGGNGGPSGSSPGQPTAHQFLLGSSNGSNTYISANSTAILTAIGGGGGGSSYIEYTPGSGGKSGGSGGGASGYYNGSTAQAWVNSSAKKGGSGIAGQGYNGGDMGSQYYSGGGGGAGGPGISGNGRPDGGPGYYSTILSPGYYWGGGGGGGAYSASTGGYGGLGGGGGGALGVAPGGAGYSQGIPGGGGSPNSQTNTPGGPGGANSGGGGGGSSHYNLTNKGGNGGSGIVVIRIPTLFYTANTSMQFDTANNKIKTAVVGFQYENAINTRFANTVGKTRVTFSQSSSLQSFVVPANVNYIFAKLWGAGGGGGSVGGWNRGSYGGAGGHTRGIIPVTPGETLNIAVSRGGYARAGTTWAPFGGTGVTTGASDNQYSGGGGGYVGVFRGNNTQANVLLMAGAGGGGTSAYAPYSKGEQWPHGGAGGGTDGQKGWCILYSWAGTGGTQTAGGIGGNGAVISGQNGSALQGGHVNAYGSPASGPYGGGGGSGYFGGGAGSHGGPSPGYAMGGGGGGSGYVANTVLLGETFTGMGFRPPFTNDPDFPKSGSTYTTHSYGGVDNAPGGDGFVVIYY